MFDFKYQPEAYFEGDTTSILLAKLYYPESKWGEQISIYAHWVESKIHYDAVDFYGNEYMLYPSSSLDPLTLEDLIYMLEGMRVDNDSAGGQMDLALDGIPQVESNLYPEIENYFKGKRKSFDLD